MQLGSIVIYTGDPLLFGKLIVVGVHADSRLLCEAMHADHHGEYARDLFDAHELVHASLWEAGG